MCGVLQMSKPLEQGIQSLSELTSIHKSQETQDTETQKVLSALLHFTLASISHPYHILLHPFGKGTFALCHCTLKVYNFLFNFYRSVWLKFALHLKGGFNSGCLKSVKIVKITETHEIE